MTPGFKFWLVYDFGNLFRCLPHKVEKIPSGSCAVIKNAFRESFRLYAGNMVYLEKVESGFEVLVHFGSKASFP